MRAFSVKSCVSGGILCDAVSERVTLAMAGKLLAALALCVVAVIVPSLPRTLAAVRSRLLQGTRVSMR